MTNHPLAGKPATPDMLSNIPELVAHYYRTAPDAEDAPHPDDAPGPEGDQER